MAWLYVYALLCLLQVLIQNFVCIFQVDIFCIISDSCTVCLNDTLLTLCLVLYDVAICVRSFGFTMFTILGVYISSRYFLYNFRFMYCLSE